MKLYINTVDAEVLLYALNYLEASDLVDRPRHGSFMEGKEQLLSELSHNIMDAIRRANDETRNKIEGNNKLK